MSTRNLSGSPSDEDAGNTRDDPSVGDFDGIESEEDWSEDHLESDPRFLKRIEVARRSIEEGRGIRLEDVE